MLQMCRGEYYDEERVAGTHLDIQQGGGNSNFFSIIFVSFKNPNIGAFLKNGEE